MNPKKIAIVGAIVCAVALTYIAMHKRRHVETVTQVVNVATNIPAEPAANSPVPNRTVRNSAQIRHRASEFTDEEKAQFIEVFEKHCKPAIAAWFNAYGDHIPFPADALTPEKLVERVSADASFGEYVFVVEGITVGLRDAKGKAEVDYLNNPKQTGKMVVIPKNAEAPISTMPIHRQEITRMVATEGGTQFPPDQIRMTPSRFSGALNGGAIVHIGGDPRNGATWKYDMVFGADNKFAYYLKEP